MAYDGTLSYTIGVDVGGTFTDLFLWSSAGDVEVAKTLSTPEDPSIGVLEGLRILAARRDATLESFAPQVRTVVHGTTVTTNAVLTRGGATTGLLTTKGVRDALEMRRGIREERYDNRYLNVPPLVPRRHRLGVGGRLDHAGRELERLDVEEVRAAASRLQGAGVEAIAICFMNAFANPAHEQEALALVKEVLPDAWACASTDVLPVVRFYNRISTTVLNAYVGPVLGDYLASLTKKLEGIGFGGVLLIMQSNGGVALPEVTAKRPATTLLSGPAAGPKAAVAHTELHGRSDCVLVDMGGTSFDASLVRDGNAALATEGEINRLRIALPMLDISTIGAGGGSIGWIDEGGLLRMGPESAGADPGPACYGGGGARPACTDADLVLGYLDPDYFAGGEMPLDIERARAAITESIAEPLGLDLDQAAAGMYRVINANMAHGVREITIKRGLDPREFPMVVAGGAGGIHACMIAHELGIPTLLVPPTSSVLCAVGMLLSDLQHDFVRTYISPFLSLDPSRLRAHVEDMVREGDAQLGAEGVEEGRRRHEVALDLRYLKQYHEVTLRVDAAWLEEGASGAIAEAFHREHDRLYGYDLAAEGTDLELINVRVRSLGLVEKPSFPTVAEGDPDPSAAGKCSRRAYVPERETFEAVPVYDGHRLRAGNVIPGPALIERVDTTIHVSASYEATIDPIGSCRMVRVGGGVMADPGSIDKVLVSIIARGLKAITDEMSLTMEKTTRSPILCEARDFVTGLYDAAGRMLEQTENLPILSFSLSPVCQHIAKTFAENIYPGDVFFHNDVFSYGNQNNDVAAFKPIFLGDTLVAWSAAKGHMADIGGAVRGGYNPNATEVWQEALRIPAVKVYERGELRKDVWDLIFANIRLDIVQEDMRAEIGSCTVGERRLLALVEKYGLDRFLAHKAYLFESTRRMVESEIRGIPNGEYRGEAKVYFDGKNPGSVYTIRVKITVEDEHITFDYSDTDAQTNGFVNGTYTSSASATLLTFLQMVNPDIPHNDGMVQPVDIVIPEGTILNASYPAATTFGNHLCPPNADAIIRALAPVIPERVTAGWNQLLCSLSTGRDPRKDDNYVDILFMGLKGGSGATADCDGYDHIGMIDASGGVLDQDYEMFEQQTPHHLEQHEYIPDSAGPGRQRGGLGVVTRYTVGGESTQIVTFGDGDVEAAFGLDGGHGSTLNYIDLHYPDGTTYRTTTKDLVPGVPGGTRYVQEAGGGGGYGSPHERPASRVRDEVEDGIITREAARDIYGVALVEGTFDLDEEETARLRGGA